MLEKQQNAFYYFARDDIEENSGKESCSTKERTKSCSRFIFYSFNVSHNSHPKVRDNCTNCKLNAEIKLN